MIETAAISARMPRLAAGLVYFGLCFVAGLALGPLREWLAPSLGYDRALALEMIILLFVSAAAARYAVNRGAAPMSTYDRGAVGGIALGALVVAEEALAQALRDQSIFSVWGSYSEEGKVVTVLLMLLLGAMPALVAPGMRGR